MSRKTVIEGIGVAALLSIIAFPLMVLGTTLLYPTVTAKLCVAAICYLYILYILTRTSTRIGRGTVGLLSALATAGLVFFSPPFPLFLIVLTGMIWLVRSLYSYQSLVFTFADALLCALSLASAMCGFMLSRSVMVAVWCYFLVQALASMIPKSFDALAAARSGNVDACRKPNRDRFGDAQRAAMEALKQLV